MWARDRGFSKAFGIVISAFCCALACGKSSSENSDGGDPSDAGQGGGGDPETGGSGGRGGTSGAGGTGARGGTAGQAQGGESGESQGGSAGEPRGGAGGSPSCGDEECADGLTCQPDLGCVKVCTAPDAILITSPAELEAFAAERCQVLDGSLTIRSATLTNVDALGQPSSLRVITGDLALDQNPALEHLEGFYGLDTIGGSLVVSSSHLENLDGLDSVRRIGSNSVTNALVLTENDRLAAVAALGALTRLLTSVVVSGNPELSSLIGIDRLRATRSVTITGNANLAEIGGLTELEESESFTVAGNPLLETLSLPSLVTVGSLTVTTNDALGSVSLPRLASAENLTIAGNQMLTTVGTLNALLDVGMLVIAGNPRLPQCFVDALDLRLMACNTSCGGNDTNAVCN